MDEIAQDLRNELHKVERANEDEGQPTAVSLPEGDSDSGKPATRSWTTQFTLQSVSGSSDEFEGPQTVDSESSLGLDEINAAFHLTYNEELRTSPLQAEQILAQVRAAEIQNAETLQEVLQSARDKISEMEDQHEGVNLTQSGRILAALRMYRDRELGLKWLEKVFQEFAEKKSAQQSFAETYSVGRETFGTVVHVTTDYALVQLPEGRTGILHATHMKKSPHEYVTVSERISEGDTITVRILAVNSNQERVELELVRDDSQAPK
jgi:hypothetical protein